MNAKDVIPVPHLRQAKNVLCVVPHPDDAELAAGGTVAVLTGEGATVTYAVVTDGGMGTFDPTVSSSEIAAVRRKEQEEAAAVLGVTRVEWLGFRDGFLPEVDALREPVVRLIRQVKPDFVLTLDPWLPYEAHPDHRKTGLAAVEAVLYAGFPLAYPQHMQEGLTPWGVTGVALALSVRPNTVINIEETWERKINACLTHKSQFPPELWDSMYLPYIQGKCMEWGREAGARVAETFKVMHPAHLHVMVDAWKV
ncbi:MAG: PIG-L deacetylase family protein [Bacillota bacterium]